MDPYDFPMPNRADLMSLSTINKEKDNMQTHTKKFHSSRAFNQALEVNDIHGNSNPAHLTQASRCPAAPPRLQGDQ